MTVPFGATAEASAIVSDPDPIPASSTVCPGSMEQFMRICAASRGRIICA